MGRPLVSVVLLVSATAEDTVVRSQPSAFSIGMISTPGVARTPAEQSSMAKTMPATIQP